MDSQRYKYGSGPNDLLPEFRRHIDSVYSQYKEIDFTILDQLRSNYMKMARKPNKPSPDFPLQTFYITKEGISYHTEKKATTMEFNNMVFQKAWDYANEHKINLPETTMYLWVSDSHPYYVDKIYEKFPILSYVSPKNMNYILFPDTSFPCMQIAGKYEGKCNGFDDIKKEILKTIESRVDKTKEDRVYFKGVSTTEWQNRTREDLAIISSGNPRDNITVDLSAIEKGQFEPMWNWVKYKYLLNLPGRYPWSNRLKYLFVMKSVVVNVDIKTIGIDDHTKGEYTDEPYNTLVNLLVEPNVDYINIVSVLDNRIKDRDQKYKDSIKFKENERLYDEIKKRTKEMTDEEYTKMIESAYEKIEPLTDNMISLYVCNLIIANAKYIKGIIKRSTPQLSMQESTRNTGQKYREQITQRSQGFEKWIAQRKERTPISEDPDGYKRLQLKPRTTIDVKK
jgi:hypothetical protein